MYGHEYQAVKQEGLGRLGREEEKEEEEEARAKVRI
jgi:hypothetical protein